MLPGEAGGTGLYSQTEWLSMYKILQILSKRLLKLISDFDKVRRYKVTMKISVTFLYSINEQLETDIKIVIYAIASKS